MLNTLQISKYSCLSLPTVFFFKYDLHEQLTRMLFSKINFKPLHFFSTLRNIFNFCSTLIILKAIFS